MESGGWWWWWWLVLCAHLVYTVQKKKTKNSSRSKQATAAASVHWTRRVPLEKTIASIGGLLFSLLSIPLAFLPSSPWNPDFILPFFIHTIFILFFIFLYRDYLFIFLYLFLFFRRFQKITNATLITFQTWSQFIKLSSAKKDINFKFKAQKNLCENNLGIFFYRKCCADFLRDPHFPWIKKLLCIKNSRDDTSDSPHDTPDNFYSLFSFFYSHHWFYYATGKSVETIPPNFSIKKWSKLLNNFIILFIFKKQMKFKQFF